MFEVVEYLDLPEPKPFRYLVRNAQSASCWEVTVSLARIEMGNLSNAKTVGGGVLEYRLDFGPGYRVYFGRDGERLIVLLGGGSKKRQQ